MMDVISYVKEKVPADLELIAQPVNQDAVVLILMPQDRKHPTAFSISGLEQFQNDDRGLMALIDTRFDVALSTLRAAAT